MSVESVTDINFPIGALVPKAETGVSSFLQKYPDFDGRDVTIAIFDSGVDPRASGLETICDGKTVKVIERFDCSGCGDVDTSKKVTAVKGCITGLSGKQLKLTQQMLTTNTANGEFHIGLKSFNDSSPKSIQDQRISMIKTKTWDGPHKTAIAEALRKINEFDAQNSDTSKLPWDKKLEKENLDNTLEMLNYFEKNYNEIKTSYDCIVYKTEEGWQTVIDVTETGDLENAIHIGEYAKTYEIKNIDDYLSVSVNIHDEGDVLEVVGMCSSHGTHVASIASGNMSSKETNGVAPNAKIVSLTIGDGRLGSMETGTALVRAMIKVMEMCKQGRKIDVINMSYGEHANWVNTGRIGELMNEIVNKYGVVWVASAGNHGPALCTVGTPPDISQPSLIGVGAYVSPQMMEAEYAMREKLPATVYTWTSRDPCIDGGQGITVCAPGAAIASVPQFTMSKTRRMNGTSMAAPHVAGAVALLISGLKQKGLPYSPFSIKRALSATASKIGYIDPFAQGHGLLNVEKAFEHSVQFSDQPDTLIRFSVTVGNQRNKGILLRDGVLDRPYDFNVDVEPLYLNDIDAAAEDKINFNIRLSLVPSEPFVQCGAFLDLSYASRSFDVKVNPVGLPEGVHTAVIKAFDTSCVEKGPLFEVPITVIQPHVINASDTRIFEPISHRNDGSIEFHPNSTQRHFILVPKSATWAVLKMRSMDLNRDKDIGKFFVHTVQLLPHKSCRSQELQKIISVNSESDCICPFSVEGNVILELCVAKYWSNYGTTHLKYSLEFHGVKSNNPTQMIAQQGIYQMNISALGIEDVQPTILLKQAAVALKPNESKISPLSATRDVIPDGRQIYQNVLTYNLNLPKTAEICVYAPLFNSLLYEAEFESQLWMIFDVNKCLISCGDAHSNKFFKKYEKGDYIVKMQVRHEKRESLEKISDANLIVLNKVSLSLDIYDYYNDCILGENKSKSFVLKNNKIKTLYVAPVSHEKLSKLNIPANCGWLNGVIAFAKDEQSRRVENQDFKYIFSPMESVKKNGNNGSSFGANQAANGNKKKDPQTSSQPPSTATSKTSLGAAAGDGNQMPIETLSSSDLSPSKTKVEVDEYAEGLRDFKCSMLPKTDSEKAAKIFTEIVKDYPNHLPAYLNYIQNIETNLVKGQIYPLSFAKSLCDADTTSEANDEKKVKDDQVRSSLTKIKELSDSVIKEVNINTLLAYYGLKNDTRPDASKIKSNMDKQKAHLLEALVKKGVATIKLSILAEDDKSKSRDNIDSIYTEAIKFVDAYDSKIINLTLWHAFVCNHYGRMYKCLQKIYEDKRSRECYEELILVAESLKYDHLQTMIERLAISAFPSSYRLF